MFSLVEILGIIDLGLLLATAGIGTASLAGWLRNHHASVPRAKATAHVAMQLGTLGLWVAFLLTGALWPAWAAFVAVNAGAAFGDRLMYASYRARHPAEGRASYLAIAGEVVRSGGPGRTMHALLAPAVIVLMLTTCILASVG